jgi:endoglucanase
MRRGRHFAIVCAAVFALSGCGDSDAPGGSAEPGTGGRKAADASASGSGDAPSGGTPASAGGAGGSADHEHDGGGSVIDASSPEDGGGAASGGATASTGGATGSGGKASGTGGCGPSAGAANPFTGAQFFVDPNSLAKQQADTWRATRPADAAQMDKLAESAWSRWLGDWVTDIAATTKSEVDAITAACSLPVLVAYNIPHRDCGGQSSGGAASAAAYRAWIRGLNTGIAGRRAVVILEPDALALQCADAAGNAERYGLLKDAVDVLTASPGVAVYIDAGHSGWIAAADMAARLKSSGIAKARGFTVNVSNFRATADEVAYGNAVVTALGGGKTFVIDTSRNGHGYGGEWCNPTGRGLGKRATSATGYAGVDAFYWIKTPGLSDGACNGGPAAGTWWPAYALGLAQRAVF